MRESTKDEKKIGTRYEQREREGGRGREKKKVIDSRVTDRQTDRDKR